MNYRDHNYGIFYAVEKYGSRLLGSFIGPGSLKRRRQIWLPNHSRWKNFYAWHCIARM